MPRTINRFQRRSKPHRCLVLRLLKAISLAAAAVLRLGVADEHGVVIALHRYRRRPVHPDIVPVSLHTHKAAGTMHLHLIVLAFHVDGVAVGTGDILREFIASDDDVLRAGLHEVSRGYLALSKG